VARSPEIRVRISDNPARPAAEAERDPRHVASSRDRPGSGRRRRPGKHAEAVILGEDVQLPIAHAEVGLPPSDPGVGSVSRSLLARAGATQHEAEPRENPPHSIRLS
jgi:hypothetical protein